MKKVAISVLIICLCMSTVLFAFLWSSQKNSNDKVIALAQNQATCSFVYFTTFKESGEIRYYWNGVASFRAFQEAYGMVLNDKNHSSDYLKCCEFYAQLLLGPEKSQHYISEICNIMELLSIDMQDENAYSQMMDLQGRMSELNN